jgi:hypothetical protein
MYKFLLLLLLASCGSSNGGYKEPAPKPAPGPTPGGGELTFASDIKPLLNSYCAECHSDATFMASEEGFLSSKAPTRIANKSMPQRQGKNAAKFGDAQRAIFAEFVADKK